MSEGVYDKKKRCSSGALCPRLLRWFRRVRSNSGNAAISPGLGQPSLRAGQRTSASRSSGVRWRSHLRRDQDVLRLRVTLVLRERIWVIQVLRFTEKGAANEDTSVMRGTKPRTYNPVVRGWDAPTPSYTADSTCLSTFERRRR